jgi:hypothetical protein
MVGIAVPEKVSEDVEIGLTGNRGQFGEPYLEDMCVLGL